VLEGVTSLNLGMSPGGKEFLPDNGKGEVGWKYWRARLAQKKFRRVVK